MSKKTKKSTAKKSTAKKSAAPPHEHGGEKRHSAGAAHQRATSTAVATAIR